MLFRKLIPILFRGIRYLFEDTFEYTGAPRPDMWTVMDDQASAPNISVVGGKLVITAPTGAWAHTALVSKAPWGPWVRVPGLTIEWQITPGSSNTEKILGWTDGTLASDGTEAHSFYIRNTAFIWIGYGAAFVSLPYAYSAATSYWARIVCVQQPDGTIKGAAYYVSSDSRATWKIIWWDSTVTTTPLYAFIESYNAALTSDKADVYQGAPPTALLVAAGQVTPTLTEKIVNGAFDADTNWSKDASWSIAAGVATKVNGVVSDIWQNVLTVGQWSIATCTLSSVTAGAFNAMFGALVGPNLTADGTYTAVGRTTTNGFARVRGSDVAAGNLDNVSFQQATLSTMLGPNQTTRKEAIWDCAITGLSAGHVGGLWVNWDGTSAGAQNAVEFVIDRTAGLLRVSKYAAGTLSNNLTTQAVTGNYAYADGCVLRVVRTSDSINFYYAIDGVTFLLVGTAQTISDTTIRSQVGAAWFCSDSAATLTLTPRVGIGVA